MLIHLFTGESLYSTRFLDFVNRYFDNQKHYFIFRRPPVSGIHYSPKITRHISYVYNWRQILLLMLPALHRARRIYIHFLPIGPSLILLALLPWLWRKCVWKVWGDDLYWFQRRSDHFVDSLYERCRRLFIRNLSEIIAPMRGDYEVALSNYHTRARYSYAIYPLPTDNKMLAQARDYRKHPAEPPVVLVGNSGDPLNYHIEALHTLAFLKNMPVKIICPLNYAGDEDYYREVMITGTHLLADRFSALTEILPPQHYLRLLATVDVAIMNHRRQQGLGNIFALIYLGKKIYLHTTTTPFQYLTGLGIRVFDTLSLARQDAGSLFSFDETDRESNYRIIREELSDAKYLTLWNAILTSVD